MTDNLRAGARVRVRGNHAVIVKRVGFDRDKHPHYLVQMDATGVEETLPARDIEPRYVHDDTDLMEIIAGELEELRMSLLPGLNSPDQNADTGTYYYELEEAIERIRQRLTNREEVGE